MFKKITFMMILILSTGYVHAGYIDGNFLKEMSNAPITERAHFQYVGYIAAVIDMDNATNICVDYSTSMQPILDTVQQYLINHSSKLNVSAVGLIQSSLKQSFPCKD
jgi:hypothetical protein